MIIFKDSFEGLSRDCFKYFSKETSKEVSKDFCTDFDKDFLKYAIGGAWIGPRSAKLPSAASQNAGHVFKHSGTIWKDASHLESLLTKVSNAFV